MNIRPIGPYGNTPRVQAVQAEAIAEADAHLNNAGLPTYTELRGAPATAACALLSRLVAWNNNPNGNGLELATMCDDAAAILEHGNTGAGG